MVVRRKFVNRPTQVPFADRNDVIQAFLLYDRTKRSAYALQFGARGGVRAIRMYVAWVGNLTQLGLADALRTWFGPPAAA